MKIFISQPMNGLKDSQILEKRAEMIRLLTDHYGEGIEIIDSFTKSEDVIGRGRVAMLGDSIMKMWDADIVLFCDGWSGSAGCTVEYEVCSRYDIKRIYEYDLKHLVESRR